MSQKSTLNESAIDFEYQVATHESAIDEKTSFTFFTSSRFEDALIHFVFSISQSLEQDRLKISDYDFFL